MSDYVLRVLAKQVNVRGLIAVTTDLSQEGAERHQTSGASTRVLAETLTAGALMGALLKVRQHVALKFEGNGPVRKAVIEADSYGRVRGYVAETALPAEMGVAEALGAAGLLTVVKDLHLKDLARGIVHLATSEVDLDLAHYLNQSEQTPSLVSTGAVTGENGEIQAAGGLLIQTMPPHDPELIGRFADRLQEFPPLEVVLNSGQTPEDIAAYLFDEIEYDQLEKRPLRFQCNCSRERTRQALISIGRQELEHLLREEGQAVVDCHFCHEHYLFEADELQQLIDSLS